MIFKEITIIAPYFEEVIPEVVEIEIEEIKNETIEEVKNDTKKEVIFEGSTAWKNTGPYFLSPIPAEIEFDLD